MPGQSIEGEALIQSIGCEIHGEAGRVVFELRTGGIVLAGYHSEPHKPLGWVILRHDGLRGEIKAISCEPGESDEPILTGHTSDGTAYQAKDYLYGDRKATWYPVDERGIDGDTPNNPTA